MPEMIETLSPFILKGELVLRLLSAILGGALLGLDRELRQKTAGLRTHMLVALAAAGFTMLTFEIYEDAQRAGNGSGADPVRVIEAVITGVAFLGAGAIIRFRGNVLGITTGASMWLAGAIGVAAGGGYYAIGLWLVLLGVAVLSGVQMVERRILASRKSEKADADPGRV